MSQYLCPAHGLPMVSDGFSGEGGTTRGLIRAGYCVTAVDNDENRLKYNPAQHKVHGDAIAFIVEHGHHFLWNWGSPTCTGYSRGTVAIPDRIGKYDRLIAATREAFIAAGRPWVIENVEDAARLGEIRNPQTLCGRMFGLSATDADGEPLVLDRHRVFEATFDIEPPAHPEHGGESVAGVYSGGRRATNKAPGTPDERRRPGESLASVAPRDRYAAKHVRKGGYVPRSKPVREALLGITGMTGKGLELSIPPIYAEHIRAVIPRPHREEERMSVPLLALPQLDGSTEAAQARLAAMDEDDRAEQVDTVLEDIRQALIEANDGAPEGGQAAVGIQEAQAKLDLLVNLLADAPVVPS